MREIIKQDVLDIEVLINKVFHTLTIIHVERLGGLTNHSYKVTLSNNKSYVVRLPGEGTSELINRHDEKVSTELACLLGIDAKLVYFDENGTKISEYIEDAVTLNAEMLREDKTVIKVAKIFSTLHNSNVDTKVPFEVFDMAKSYEDIINKYHVSMYDDYNEIKNKVMSIKQFVDKDGDVKKVPCHNDSLCENWVYSGERLYLIDWEYAGMNDGMWDLADISIEADYSDEQDDLLLKSYYNRDASSHEKNRFIANKLYLDYLWTLWGKTRVPYDGDEMEEYALNRYLRLKENIKKFEEGLSDL